MGPGRLGCEEGVFDHHRCLSACLESEKKRREKGKKISKEIIRDARGWQIDETSSIMLREGLRGPGLGEAVGERWHSIKREGKRP